MPKDKKWSRLPSRFRDFAGLQLYNFIKGKSSIFYSICTNFKFMHKVINIIHNICTKFGGIGTFFVDVFVGFSTKALFIHCFDIFRKLAACINVK